MATKQRQVPTKIKGQLINEAGGKCANPGCDSWRSHIHHIKHWSVYKAHDANHMIAVCPTCHDAIHFGRLKISDDTLYAWKAIERSNDSYRSHIYIEPADDLKILAGTVALATTNQDFVAFNLSNSNTLAFKVLDGDILLLRASILSMDGQEVLRVSDNHVTIRKDDGVDFQKRPGRVRCTLPASKRYVFPWVVDLMRMVDPSFASDGRILALDLDVIGPGLVRAQGMWAAPEGAVIITEKCLSLLRPGWPHPKSMYGAGETSVLKFAGTVSAALFNF